MKVAIYGDPVFSDKAMLCETISTMRFHGNFCVGSPRNFPSMIYLPIPKPFRQVRVDRTNYYVGTYYWDILPKYIICWEHLDYIVYIYIHMVFMLVRHYWQLKFRSGGHD